MRPYLYCIDMTNGSRFSPGVLAWFRGILVGRIFVSVKFSLSFFLLKNLLPSQKFSSSTKKPKSKEFLGPYFRSPDSELKSQFDNFLFSTQNRTQIVETKCSYFL